VDKYSSACDDNITQVQLFYRKVLDEEARERLTDNIATSLIYASKKVQERTLANFKEVDEHYARRVKEKMDQMLKAKESVPKSKKRITAPLNPPRKGFEPVAP
jgi:catalase